MAGRRRQRAFWRGAREALSAIRAPTCALVCALVGGAPLSVLAAEPIVVTVTGRINQFAFVRDDTDAPTVPVEKTNPTGLFTYGRLAIEGQSTIADNITVRGVARFIANDRQPNNMDEVYVEASGPFGRLQLGDRQAVNAMMINSAVPQAFLNVSDEIIASAVRPRTETTMRDGLSFKRYSRGSTAITYQSPRWNTLQLGAGYYPRGATPISTTQRIDTKNATETTLSHVGRVSDNIQYRVLAGYFRADGTLGADDIKAWNLSATIEVGPFEIGGTMINVAPILGLREVNWTAGAMYETGPWRFSTDFRRAKRTNNGVTFEKVERTMMQASYRLGPGINLGGTLFQSFQRDSLRQVWRSRGAIVGVTIGF